MKNFLGKFFNKNSLKTQKKGYQIIGKQGNCLVHDTAIYPNIKANHHCQTCNVDTCYMCAGKHFENKCDVIWSNKDLQQVAINEKQLLFNKGYFSKFRLSNLFCPCGSKIDQDDIHSGMCVACGTATCSTECHDKYAVKEGHCTFHHNFSEELQGQNMRSLVFKSIKYLKDKGYSDYTRINRTSQNFIVGYLGTVHDEIYIQRGFRQYGNPLPETLDNLDVIAKDNLDYILHISRMCDCNCSTCDSKDIHPVYNCEIDCKKKESLAFTDLSQDERMQNICDCDCSFCNSGISILKHRKLDCAFNCEYSTFNFNNTK